MKNLEKLKISEKSQKSGRAFIVGKKIYLRPVETEDAQFICQGENNEIVRDALFLAFPQTVSQIQEKIENSINDPNQIVFMIVDKKDDIVVGQTAFFRIDFVSRSAIFYLAILNPEYWHSGIGTETTQLMINYAFRTLNLNRIQLHVNAENTPAIKIYQKVGFKKEGVLRQAMYKNSRYYDFWVMGILREDLESM